MHYFKKQFFEVKRKVWRKQISVSRIRSLEVKGLQRWGHGTLARGTCSACPLNLD